MALRTKTYHPKKGIMYNVDGVYMTEEEIKKKVKKKIKEKEK